MSGSRCFKEIGILGSGVCPELQEFGHCRLCPQYFLAGRSLFERPVPAEWLEEWTGIFAEEKGVEPSGILTATVFRIGTEWLALDAARFIRIMNPRTIHTVPFRSGPVFLGLVNIDGDLLPCLSLSRIIGLEENLSEEGAAPRLALVEHGGARFAFIADEVLEVRRIAPSEIGGPPSTVAKSPHALTWGVFSIGGKSVGILDEDKFFAVLGESLRS